MNISRENIDELNAVLTIEFEKADYEPKVDKAVKDYGKKVAIKGFRPGHAPASMIKRMYGKSILVDQVNTLVGETLSNYIKENNLDILGEPLPNKDQQQIDFDKEVDKLSFKFDIAISPVVSVGIDKGLTIPSYTIVVDDAAVKEQVENIVARHGGHVPVEVSTEASLVKGTVSVADFKNDKGLLSVTVIKDEAEKAKFVGKKAGDTVEFDLRKACPDNKEISYLLGIGDDEAAAIAADAVATIVISEVSEFKNAELNAELFSRLYPDGGVADEEAFRARVKADLEKSNAMAQDYRFSVDARDAMLNAAGDIKLPEEFLKRWLTAINRDNDKFTPEVLDKEFPKFLDDLRWQIVKNCVAKALDIKVEFADVLEFAKKSTRAQFMQYGLTNLPDEQVDKYAHNMLRDEEQRNRLAAGAADDKIFSYAKENANVEAKSVTQEQFGQLFETGK